MPRIHLAAAMAAITLIACAPTEAPLSPPPPPPPPSETPSTSCALVGTPNPAVIGLLTKAWASKELAVAHRAK